jgi:hypothetical protein
MQPDEVDELFNFCCDFDSDSADFLDLYLDDPAASAEKPPVPFDVSPGTLACESPAPASVRFAPLGKTAPAAAPEQPPASASATPDTEVDDREGARSALQAVQTGQATAGPLPGAPERACSASELPPAHGVLPAAASHGLQRESNRQAQARLRVRQKVRAGDYLRCM